MRRPSVLTLAGWLAISPLIISCASSPPVELPPTPSQASAKAVSNDYIIGPGDTLQVFVWRNPELSVTIPVRPDGKTHPAGGEHGGDRQDRAAAIARSGDRAEYVRSPKVNIIVTTAASAFSLVKVVGQVTHPQALPYREGMTVLDAVLEVGGLSQFASGNRARIVRMVNGQQTTIHVKLADLVNSGDVRENVALKSGDVLVVPQSLF
jgi:polysaccharide export outer membrane protein